MTGFIYHECLMRDCSAEPLAPVTENIIFLIYYFLLLLNKTCMESLAIKSSSWEAGFGCNLFPLICSDQPANYYLFVSIIFEINLTAEKQPRLTAACCNLALSAFYLSVCLFLSHSLSPQSVLLITDVRFDKSDVFTTLNCNWSYRFSL